MYIRISMYKQKYSPSKRRREPLLTVKTQHWLTSNSPNCNPDSTACHGGWGPVKMRQLLCLLPGGTGYLKSQIGTSSGIQVASSLSFFFSALTFECK